MGTAATLEIAIMLRDKLLSSEADERWILSRKALKTLILLSTYQLNYEGMKTIGMRGQVNFFEGGEPMTEVEKKELKEAKAINKQMAKILRERRLAKK